MWARGLEDLTLCGPWSPSKQLFPPNSLYTYMANEYEGSKIERSPTTKKMKSKTFSSCDNRLVAPSVRYVRYMPSSALRIPFPLHFLSRTINPEVIRPRMAAIPHGGVNRAATTAKDEARLLPLKEQTEHAQRGRLGVTLPRPSAPHTSPRPRPPRRPRPPQQRLHALRPRPTT